MLGTRRGRGCGECLHGNIARGSSLKCAGDFGFGGDGSSKVVSLGFGDEDGSFFVSRSCGCCGCCGCCGDVSTCCEYPCES